MLSFIIPTLNEEKIIETTIANLKKVAPSPYEIIVSDGGSTDNTVQKVQRLGVRVITCSDPVNQNIAKNRNNGGIHAKGEYLVFMDADSCFISSNFFMKAIARFESNPKLLALTSKIKTYPETATFADRFFEFFVNLTYWFSNNVMKSGWAQGKFMMVRKDAYAQVNGFREDLITCEDGDFFVRLAKIGKVYTDMSLVTYQSGRRVHSIGWPKLLYLWIVNSVSYWTRSKSVSKHWKHFEK